MEKIAKKLEEAVKEHELIKAGIEIVDRKVDSSIYERKAETSAIRAEAKLTHKELSMEIKEIRKDVNQVSKDVCSVKDDIGKLDDKLDTMIKSLDFRYANKRTEKMVDAIVWLFASAVIIALISLVIVK